MYGKGHPLSRDELQRVASLLSSTDMSIQEIAERMKRSNATIISINRKLHIRDYSGRRTTWDVPPRGSVLAVNLQRVTILSEADKSRVPQVIVGCPFEVLELSDECRS